VVKPEHLFSFGHYIEQEERYTSKARGLDGDAGPLWNGPPHDVQFVDQHVKRGWYRTKAALILNADVSDVANILRKSHHRLDVERVGRGLLANPLRVKRTSVGSS